MFRKRPLRIQSYVLNYITPEVCKEYRYYVERCKNNNEVWMQISPRSVYGGGGILDLCYVASSGFDVVYIGMAKKG